MLILDADGLIKLYRAGVLEKVARAYECMVPGGVYHEAVTRARERGHPDAEAMDKIVGRHTRVVKPMEPIGGIEGQRTQLGVGEREALSLALTGQSQSEVKPVVVSDDRSFLTYLTGLGIPFLPPSGLIVEMVRQGSLTSAEGLDALERIQSLIRPMDYRQAMQRLQEEGFP